MIPGLANYLKIESSVILKKVKEHNYERQRKYR